MKDLKVVSDSDGVVITGVEQKADGAVDPQLTITVPLAAVASLPGLPEMPRYYENTLAVWVPSAGVWVCVNRCHWQENASGSNPMEEAIEPQPFVLAPPAVQGSDEEEVETIETKGTLYKWVALYPETRNSDGWS